ncbi:PapC/FimD family outer membrane usher protein [Comamonas testosteroni]|jgi:hypothetical protein|nr:MULTISPECIES: PapC/FimD family outer membrane usher protein [Comamonas]WQG64533.1 PapC/FimD family outer membrane usher protein [Comamonas testosteroni]
MSFRYFGPSRALLMSTFLGATVLCASPGFAYADTVEFNADLLDVKDRDNIDLSAFSTKGYVLPGVYDLLVNINGQALKTVPVRFISPEGDKKESRVCIDQSLVEKLGLTEDAMVKVKWWNDGECLIVDSVNGMEVRPDVSKNLLYLNIPQVNLEYNAPYWDPPSRWEDGISGAVFDYYLAAQHMDQTSGGSSTRFTGNGVVGANLGAWRLRAGWQANSQSNSNSGAASNPSQSKFSWTDVTLYRPLPQYKARLAIGESYLESNLFDTFRYTGVGLKSDDAMLPPNLRGYAPEVSGVAQTNAKVTISQQGRVIKEILVPAGPFRIQDLDRSTSGQLDVRVEESDGRVQTFQVNTASIPYLTRPGQLRYKAMAGKPSEMNHRMNGPVFAGGEVSWGASNNVSLYGGSILSGKYQAFSAGIGRDLAQFGALSFDVTHSRAQLRDMESWRGGNSYRLSYSKVFDATRSQVTFAGYRFSDQNFLSMSDYLRLSQDYSAMRPKQMYTVALNQQFDKVSAYLSINRLTYWNNAESLRYNLSASTYFNFGNFRNVSVSMNAYSSEYNGKKDNGVFLSMSIPWGNSGTLGYSGAYGSSKSQSVSYSDRTSPNDYYTLRGGETGGRAEGSAYYSRDTSLAKVDAMASYRAQDYSSLNVSVRGGLTVTPEGGALHPVGASGGTRVLVDTNGVAGVPVGRFGSKIKSNMFGKAVVSNVGSYNRNSIDIDVNGMPDNVQANNSISTGTFTEGAIGYRKFDMLVGEKAMLSLQTKDGSFPPFGARVFNEKQQELGLVGEQGVTYVNGIVAGEQLQVKWGDTGQCQVQLSDTLPGDLSDSLTVQCQE